MNRRTLGSQGLEVSAEGLGCMGMTWAYGAGDEASGLRTIHRALELGITFLDTAEVYGPYTNERLVGRAIAGQRDRFEIATKFGFVVNPESPSDRAIDGSPKNARRACEGSLERLGTDHIDLFYQHRVDPNVPIEETVGAMAELVGEGKVRYLGLSEASAETIRRAHATHPITAVQMEYSLWTRDLEDGVLPTLRELGIGLVAYSPLGRGFLTGQIRSLDDLPEEWTGSLLCISSVTNNTTGAADTTTYAYYSGSSVPGGITCAADSGEGAIAYGVTVETDPNGYQTTYCYDTHDRVYETADAYEKPTMISYDWDDDVTQVIEPGGQTSTTTYDACFRPTETEGPGTSSLNPAITTTFYGTASDPYETDPYPTGSSCGASPGDGYLASASVGAAGNANTDPEAYGTTYQYDGNGNLTEEIDGLPSHNTLTFTYKPTCTPGTRGACGEIASSTNANGHTTTYGYDTKGNLTSVIPQSPLGEDTYTYDADSRLATSTDGDEHETSFQYDGDDNMTKETYADSSTTTNTYDGDGNLTKSVDSSTGTTNYTYDLKNRLTSETDPGAGGQPATTTSYTYDGDDNMVSLTDGGGTVTYGYDHDDRATSVQEPSVSSPIGFTYNTNGQLTCTTYPNGVVVQPGYDYAGDLTSIQAANGSGAACNPLSSTGTPNGTLLSDPSLSYNYGNSNNDNTGLIQSETINGNTWDYYYDALNRLVEATPTTGTTLNYSYDPDGNILTQTNPLTGVVQTQTYNAADELCWVYQGSVTSPTCSSPPLGAGAYTYDADGNTLTRGDTGGTTSLGYNDRAQTSSINPDGTGALTLSYRGSGQDDLVQDGNQPEGGEAPAVLENVLGISGQESAVDMDGEALDTYYTRAQNGQLLGERTPTGNYYYIEDANGSVMAITNSAGAVANTYTYSPYGVTTSSTGSAPNSFGFDGGLEMPGGLYKFGERYYDPATGNWTQPDPLVKDEPFAHLEDPTQISDLSYAGDDPVSSTDPTGESDQVCSESRPCKPPKHHRRKHKKATNSCGGKSVSCPSNGPGRPEVGGGGNPGDGSVNGDPAYYFNGQPGDGPEGCSPDIPTAGDQAHGCSG